MAGELDLDLKDNDHLFSWKVLDLLVKLFEIQCILVRLISGNKCSCLSPPHSIHLCLLPYFLISLFQQLYCSYHTHRTLVHTKRSSNVSQKMQWRIIDFACIQPGQNLSQLQLCRLDLFTTKDSIRKENAYMSVCMY